MSVSEIMQSKQTQDLLKRVAEIEANKEEKTVVLVPLFGMYAPVDSSISTEEQLNTFIDSEKNMVADYERSIIDRYKPYSYDFNGKSEWYDLQESRYRTRLSKALDEFDGEFDDKGTVCYLAEMKARYVDIDREKYHLPRDIDSVMVVPTVEIYAGIRSFRELAENDYIFLDTETTGFDFEKDEIIELGITDINGNVIYDGMFKPEVENSAEAQKANHISNEELQDKPRFSEEWERIKAAVAGRRIATYNRDFDRNIMVATAKKYNIPVEEVETMFKDSACVMQSYTDFKHDYRTSKLQNALAENNIDVIQDHRAVSDCKITAQLVQAVRIKEAERDMLKLEEGSGFKIDFPSNVTFHIVTHDDNRLGTQYKKEWSGVPSVWIGQTDNSKPIEGNTDKISEAEYRHGLEIVSRSDFAPQNLKDWCNTVLAKANELEKAIIGNPNRSIKTSVDGKNTNELYIEIAKYDYEKTPQSLEDIEYYLIYDNIIGGSHSIYEIAEKIVNYRIYEKSYDLAIDDLQEFYDDNIYPLRNKPHEEWSETDKENYGLFSDRYKDCYGRRPRGDDHVCYERHKRENSNELENTYRIYQLKEENLREYGFMPYSANEGKVTFDNYNLVYQGNLEDIKGDDDFAKLNYVYNMFNFNHPEDFTEHSLSMSDVVVFNNGNDEQAYYVDRFGFAEMPEFIQQKNRESLENAVKTTEQDKPKEIVITERSAAIESTDDVPNRPDFHSLNGMDLYRIIIPNETQPKVDVLNNVTYPDRETAKSELERLGYEEVPYDNLITFVGNNMIEQENAFIAAYAENQPKVIVEWSEHSEIPDNSEFSLSEFSHLMERLDKKWIEEVNAGRELGYAKTKFTINNVVCGIENGQPIINSFLCRQDIGDGDGSLADHVRLTAESERAMYESWGTDSIENWSEIERAINARANYASPYIKWAVGYEDRVREENKELQAEQSEQQQEIHFDEPPKTLTLDEVEKEIESGFAKELKNAQKIAEFIIHSEPEHPEDDSLSVYYRDNESGEIYYITKFFEEVEVEYNGEIGVEGASFTRGMPPEELIKLADRATTNPRFEIIMPLSDETRELFTKGKEQTQESSNSLEKNTQALMSIEIAGETYYFKVEDVSAEDIIKTAQSEKPLLDLQEMGEKITSSNYAEIQQSDRFSFSVEMNIDDDTVNIYTVNDGKGGIPEADRTDDNTSMVESKLSEYGKTEEEKALAETATEEKPSKKPQAITVETQYFGNTSYRSIKDKKFINTTSESAREIFTALNKNGIKFSGIIRGKNGTITISQNDEQKFWAIIKAAKITLDKTSNENEVEDNGKIVINSKESCDKFIKDKITEIMDSEKFINFCKTDSLWILSQYSLNNALLVLGQNPNATYCNTANEWQKFGRIIKGGEHGYKIKVPNILSEKNIGQYWSQIKRDIKNSFDVQKGYGETKLYNTDVVITGYNGVYDVKSHGKNVISHKDEKLVKNWIEQNLINHTVIGFSMGTVFDVSQTTTDTDYVWLKAGEFDKKDLILKDGEPIKNKAGRYKVKNTEERKNSFVPFMSAKIDPQNKEKMELLYDILKSVSDKNRSCPVIEATPVDDNELVNAKGYYSPLNNKIVMRRDMEITDKVAVLIHEMAHSQLHNLAEQAKNKSTVKEKEVQAEAVACIVANRFGIDTKHSSFNYISNFVETRNLDYLEKSLEAIWNGVKVLSNDIEREIADRGLETNLEAKKEPIPSEKIADIAKNYAEIATEIKEITQNNMDKALLAYKHSVVSEVKAHKKEEIALFDKAIGECNSIISNTENLEKMSTRAKQDDCIEKIKAGFDSITTLMNNAAEIESAVKEIPVPETAQEQFLRYPMNYMNTAELFKGVGDEEKTIIANSKFIAENYSHLLESSPKEFLKCATQQASNIKSAMSKNGTAVEVVNAEIWGAEKEPLQKGMVMHPIVAEKAITKNESSIRMAKREAERQGEYYPTSKTDLTIYSKIDTITAKGITALNTTLYVGDGSQEGLADRLEKGSKGKGVAIVDICDKFFESQKEKIDRSEKLFCAEKPTQANETHKESTKTRSLTEWRDIAMQSKAERDKEIQENSKNNREADISDSKSEDEMVFD